jgi:K+-transporting ATPase KdpF subunit
MENHMTSILALATAPAAPASHAFVLYLTAALTVAALIYLTYAMIRPERF